MQTLKIFLASSAELKSDREQFEIFINRKNKLWTKRGVFLHLEIWEDFLDAMSQTRLQNEYNKAIRACDIFVMLFCTKVGKYTAEEFETAFGQFKATKKPLIFTYFRDNATSRGNATREDLRSLWAFQDKLKALGHFQSVYQNVEGLREHFGNQLDKLEDDGFIRFAPPPAIIPSSDKPNIPPPAHQAAVSAGDFFRQRRRIAGDQNKALCRKTFVALGQRRGRHRQNFGGLAILPHVSKGIRPRSVAVERKEYCECPAVASRVAGAAIRREATRQRAARPPAHGQGRAARTVPAGH